MDFIETFDIDSIEKIDDVNMVDIEVEEDKSFILSNGVISHNSAVSSALRVRNIQTQGFFPLRGNVLNTYNAKESDIIANKELSNIMAILNLKFPEYYKIELDDGTEVIASINDEVYNNGKWIKVEDII